MDCSGRNNKMNSLLFQIHGIRPNRSLDRRQRLCPQCRSSVRKSALRTTVIPPKPEVSAPEKSYKIIKNIFIAGLMAVAVASVSLVVRLQKARTTKQKKPLVDSLGTEALTSQDDAAIAAMAPLLLAAETAAEVDETGSMSSEDLVELEITLRTLISGMEAQLEGLKDQLQSSVLPEDALEELDTLMLTSEEDSVDGWKEFALYARYCSDEEKRTYRSLLFNRSVQSKLLEQVEREMMSRSVGEGREEGLELGEMNAECAGQVSCAYISAASIPHPDKLETGGEDAHFIDEESYTFGIADGVGGWADSGIDPAEYSRSLMGHCATFSSGNYMAKDILQRAFEKTNVPGSCTAIIAKYLPYENILDVVSVGDCSMRLIRDGTVLYQTDIQEHGWNQPYQLSDPAHNIANSPDDALEYSYDVKQGDIIILGSDGFFDNMWDDELVDAIQASAMLRRSYDGSEGWGIEVEDMAQRLAELAQAHSIDEKYASPFADEKTKLAPDNKGVLGLLLPNKGNQVTYRGGKSDDITVIVCVIV
jgi:protein phosphatase PTC7